MATSLLLCFLVLCCVSMLRSLRYLRIPRAVARAEAEPLSAPAAVLPPLSVVVTAHEQCDALRRHLPLLLEQEYAQAFEVIVVDMNSTDDTAAYLESLSGRHPHLHVCHLPSSARNVSPIRLALTLGIRAANYDWVVLTQADCAPASSRWLARLGICCAEEGKQVVVGHTVTGHLLTDWQQMFRLLHIARHGAYCATGTNLCYRRSLFLSHRGFADDAHLLTGAAEIMVNRHSSRANTACCLHPDALVRQDRPALSGRWRRDQLFYMEAQRHFRRHRLLRTDWVLEVLMPLCVMLAFAAALAGELLTDRRPAVVAVVVVLALVQTAVAGRCMWRAARALQLPSAGMAMPFVRHAAALADVLVWLRWCFTRKRVFHKRFI